MVICVLKLERVLRIPENCSHTTVFLFTTDGVGGEALDDVEGTEVLLFFTGIYNYKYEGIFKYFFQ